MPLPWETDWSLEGKPKQASSYPEPKKQTKPWEVDWAVVNKAPETPQKRSTIDDQGAGNTNTLESVFKKLLVAESGSKHIDEKTGKLVTSPVGAQGISQLMPSTAKNPGYGITPVKDESEAEYLRVGKEYLSAMYRKYGDWEKALAAYNSGSGNVDKALGKAERFERDWKEFLPKPKETLPYIEKILGEKRASK